MGWTWTYSFIAIEFSSDKKNIVGFEYECKSGLSAED